MLNFSESSKGKVLVVSSNSETSPVLGTSVFAESLIDSKTSEAANPAPPNSEVSSELGSLELGTPSVPTPLDEAKPSASVSKWAPTRNSSITCSLRLRFLTAANHQANNEPKNPTPNTPTISLKLSEWSNASSVVAETVIPSTFWVVVFPAKSTTSTSIE